MCCWHLKAKRRLCCGWVVTCTYQRAVYQFNFRSSMLHVHLPTGQIWKSFFLFFPLWVHDDWSYQNCTAHVKVLAGQQAHKPDSLSEAKWCTGHHFAGAKRSHDHRRRTVQNWLSGNKNQNNLMLKKKNKKKSLPWGYLCIYLKKQKNILTFFLPQMWGKSKGKKKFNKKLSR